MLVYCFSNVVMAGMQMVSIAVNKVLIRTERCVPNLATFAVHAKFFTHETIITVISIHMLGFSRVLGFFVPSIRRSVPGC